MRGSNLGLRIAPSLSHLARSMLLVVIAWAFCAWPGSEGKGQSLVFSERDRILVLAPHPDDEVLGCGGIIQNAVAQRLPLRVVFLTNGDFNERSFAVYRRHLVLEPRAVIEMGRIRLNEALAAARILDVPTNNVVFLGYPDFGTLQIFEAHWGEQPPFRSYLTRQTHVPYQHALHFGAPHKGESILGDLKEEIRSFQPTKVFVSHPADHHPDHRALFLYTQIALWDLGIKPEVFPYLIHRAGWPAPQDFHPNLPLNPPADLWEVAQWGRSPLSSEAILRKRDALEAHKTQFGYSAAALSSFLR
ncbi:MAG TPA: PIG-L family deacetylase, partial [Clostridia bacterium]|nr:PIG-L family deacetylase [Clostridia bacterium]